MAFEAIAGTLEGKITGADGRPGAYLRVDVSGARKAVSVTDENGVFRIDVPGGQYRIRITDGTRQMESSVLVNQSGTTQWGMKLQW
jgi:hypothetical protein